MLIRNCVGFSYNRGHLCGSMLLVRGKRVVKVRLVWPLYVVMARLWISKNILGKILFRKSLGFEHI
jgi:hypothetical protein